MSWASNWSPCAREQVVSPSPSLLSHTFPFRFLSLPSTLSLSWGPSPKFSYSYGAKGSAVCSPVECGIMPQLPSIFGHLEASKKSSIMYEHVSEIWSLGDWCCSYFTWITHSVLWPNVLWQINEQHAYTLHYHSMLSLTWITFIVTHTLQ